VGAIFGVLTPKKDFFDKLKGQSPFAGECSYKMPNSKKKDFLTSRNNDPLFCVTSAEKCNTKLKKCKKSKKISNSPLIYSQKSCIMIVYADGCCESSAGSQA
jgi:hypothetical protein